MKKQKNTNPELLLPVGNTEAFYAALKAKADAIYLGLRNFNARARATNFTPWQAAAMIKEAHQNNTKVYITLNTVIRNNELNSLIDTLFVLSKLKPDAVIIQDWGVYFLIKKYFPTLHIHASTQMANHNSVGVDYSAKMGIERVVLARELTMPELEIIAKNKKTELELFVHGALCYSFSGMCLFSSFLGGMGANRGNCTQPCRRIYKQNNSEEYFFSLKDNQLIQHIPKLKELNIDSLKIEGRLKPAEYVYRVANAYKKALENDQAIPASENELKLDLGREKTEYFFGKQVSDAITQSANTGLLLGHVTNIENKQITFTSNIPPENNSRLRFRNKKSDKQIVLKIESFEKNSQNNSYSFETTNDQITSDDEVYLAGQKIKLQSKIKTDNVKIIDRAPRSLVAKALNNLKSKNTYKKKISIFLRIDSIQWMRKIRFENYNSVLLNFSITELKIFDPKLPFIQKNKNKIWIELPKFIAEKNINQYKEILEKLMQNKIVNFSISHLSQKELLPDNARFMCNENVYTFNDAAIAHIKNQGACSYIYPLENDIVNFANGNQRDGIVPVYFYPHLFFSRMPVNLKNNVEFTDKTGETFTKIVRDGVSIVLPKNPVSLTQYKNKLEKYGYTNYLIDLSHTLPSKNTPETIKKRLLKSEQIQPSSNFNFKREMK
jgi:putative protease